MMDFLFFLNSLFLGIGLAMDAFSVSLANGLHEPGMRWAKMGMVAGTFAFFQWLMPMVGWYCVHFIVELFHSAAPYIPWIAFILLLFIGGSMIREGFGGEEEIHTGVGAKGLLVQGVATSMDALSVGFTIEEMNAWMAFVCSVIIAAATFVLCVAGVLIGKRFGLRLADRATIFGGLILIGIGLEILIS